MTNKSNQQRIEENDENLVQRAVHLDGQEVQVGLKIKEDQKRIEMLERAGAEQNCGPDQVMQDMG